MSNFFNKKSLILACHITGIYDVNRNNTLPNDDYSYVKEWAESIADLQLEGIIFHNNFSETTCQKYQNAYVSFVKINHDPQFNPNVFRYLVYRDFLNAHSASINALFITDVSDVVTLNNPFVQPLFEANPHLIFCGDEPKILDNDWMYAHSAHLRTKIADYEAYETQFKKATLLNCGIIGGHIHAMVDFINQLCHIHKTYNFDNTSAYTGDMGAFNYLIRTQFNKRVLHGSPINTEFKAYQNARKDCWFRHK